LILGGELAVLQASMFDGQSLDPFSLFDDGYQLKAPISANQTGTDRACKLSFVYAARAVQDAPVNDCWSDLPDVERRFPDGIKSRM